MLPLHWDHQGEPEDIVGHVNPTSMNETPDGLRIEAQLDLEESNRAREIWRLVKANSVGLSFGYLVTNERQGADGVRELHDIDLFEVSITPAPMNPDARILSSKGATDELPTEADQRRRAERLTMTPEQQRELDRWLGVCNEAIGGTKATAPATNSKGPIRMARFPVE
jgi:HK97 family phage prohead protease